MFYQLFGTTAKKARNQRKASKRLSEAMALVIDQKKEKKSDVERDLLDILVNLRKENNDFLTTENLIDHSKTFLLAGHETTSTALTWVFYLLALHPDIDRKLAAEVRSTLGGKIPTVEILDSMKYLTKVVKESMRVFPPVPFIMRKCEEDDVLGGYKIPKGTAVMINMYTLHHHPDLWEDPETFNPDRWEDGDESSKVHPGAYLPFLLGSRNCIGNRFALLELKAILSMVVQRFRLRLIDGHPPITRTTRITMRPSPAIKMIVENRD